MRLRLRRALRRLHVLSRWQDMARERPLLMRFALWLAGHGEPDHIVELGDDGVRGYYMKRYWLLRTPWFSMRVHNICRADRDRHLHDHPWAFVSVILAGGYLEARPKTTTPAFSLVGRETVISSSHYAGDIVFRRAADRHKIVDVLANTWTLVFLGPVTKPWGFYTPDGFIDSEEYEEWKRRSTQYATRIPQR